MCAAFFIPVGQTEDAMAKITRTIRVRGSRRTTGFVFLFTGVVCFVIGWMQGFTALIWLSIAIFTFLSALFLLRRRTVVTLDDKGIRYKSPFWNLYFLWNEIQSCGVYYVRNREVYLQCPGQAEVQHGWPLTIFVSTRMHYVPRRQERFINRCSIHFRWNPEAWNVIVKKVRQEALGV